MTLTFRHFDGALVRAYAKHAGGVAARTRDSTEPDATQRRFVDVLDDALHGRRVGKARDCSGFSREQMATLAQADLIGFARASEEHMDAARRAFREKHRDVIALGANMAISNNSLPSDPADKQAYDVDGEEAEISIRADHPKAGSAAGVTDMSARDRASAIAAKSVRAMQRAADEFWSTASKPAVTAIEKVQSAAEAFWRT
jgi:hypothetical protein